VAGGTIVAAVDMLLRFSSSQSAVMATHAVAGNFRVVNAFQGKPARGSVAAFTLVGCWWMICRFAFAFCTIMAGDAGAGGKEMIKAGDSEIPELVAFTTIQGGGDMCGCFA